MELEAADTDEVAVVKVKVVKVALLSISCMSDIQGIDKNVSHSPTVKHIKCTGTTTDKTRHL